MAILNHTKLNFWADYVHIINGQSVPTVENRTAVNPANLQVLPSVPIATKQDLDDAVAAAKVAFETWSKVPYEERRKAVLAYADAVEGYQKEFEQLLTTEQGKPVGPTIFISYIPFFLFLIPVNILT